MCAVSAHHQIGIVGRASKDLMFISCICPLRVNVTGLRWQRCFDLLLIKPLKIVWTIWLFLPVVQLHLQTFQGWLSYSVAIFTLGAIQCFLLMAIFNLIQKGVPKWDPWSCVGVSMGHSSAHVSSVEIVLNPQTGHILPQFHVNFDDTFSTVKSIQWELIPHYFATLSNLQYSIQENFYQTKTCCETINGPSNLVGAHSWLQIMANKGATPLPLWSSDKIVFVTQPETRKTEPHPQKKGDFSPSSIHNSLSLAPNSRL